MSPSSAVDMPGFELPAKMADKNSHSLSVRAWLPACLQRARMCVRSEIFSHYGNTPIQIYWKFYNQKRKIFR